MVKEMKITKASCAWLVLCAICCVSGQDSIGDKIEANQMLIAQLNVSLLSQAMLAHYTMAQKAFVN